MIYVMIYVKLCYMLYVMLYMLWEKKCGEFESFCGENFCGESFCGESFCRESFSEYIICKFVLYVMINVEHSHYMLCTTITNKTNTINKLQQQKVYKSQQ